MKIIIFALFPISLAATTSSPSLLTAYWILQATKGTTAHHLASVAQTRTQRRVEQNNTFLRLYKEGQCIKTAALIAGLKAGTPTNALWYLQWFVSDKLIEDNVFFYLYSRGNLNVPQQLYLENRSALKNSYFDHRKKTVILIHGFDTDYTGTTVQRPKDKYLELFNYNAIALDYGNINSDSLLKYLQVVAYSYKIGRFLGKFINFLTTQGVNASDIHVVGHSLGAHIAGFAGKFTKMSQITIGRITGLAPCYPGYEDNSLSYRLASDDATFTDCIFTDYNNLDMGIPACQANFFPNGVGLSQPGCFRDDLLGSCSHSRAVDLFVESIEPQSSFKVEICAEVPLTTKTEYCWPTNATFMGEYANPKLAGLFYLKTNAAYPFSQG